MINTLRRFFTKGNTYIPNEDVRYWFEFIIHSMTANMLLDNSSCLCYCVDLPLYFFPKQYRDVITHCIMYNSSIKIQTNNIQKYENNMQMINTLELSKEKLQDLLKIVKCEEKTLTMLPKWRQTIDHYTDFSKRTFERIINPTKKLFEIVLLARAKFVGKLIGITIYDNDSDNKIETYLTNEELITPVIKRIPTEFKTIDWCRKLVLQCPSLSIVFKEYEYSMDIYNTILIQNCEISRKNIAILTTYNNFRMAYITFYKQNICKQNIRKQNICKQNAFYKNILYEDAPELLLCTKRCYSNNYTKKINHILAQCIIKKRQFVDNKQAMWSIVDNLNRANTNVAIDMKLYCFTNRKYITLPAYEEIIIKMFLLKHIPRSCSSIILDFIIPTDKEKRNDFAYEIFEKNANTYPQRIIYNILFNIECPKIHVDCINIILLYINTSDIV